MLSREIEQENVSELDRKLQRMIYDALIENNILDFQYACEQIYNSYYNLLKYVARDKINDINDVEDVVLDSLSVVFHSIMQRNNIRCIKSYLFAIFTCKCIEYNLKNKKNYRLEEITENIEDYSDRKNMIELIEVNDLINRCLNPKEKYILIQYLLKGKSLNSIKEELEFKHIDIYKMYKNAVNKLKKGVGKVYGYRK